MIATTDPLTLPDVTTCSGVTNLPAPGAPRVADSELAAASLEEVVRLYGLRLWIEQSSTQGKHALGWSQYQVRSDRAMRRHWQLVCCAFSFCWYHASHGAQSTTAQPLEAFESSGVLNVGVPAAEAGTGKKSSAAPVLRPKLSWPVALRAVRGWLEPWIMLRRSWRGWSPQPPPPALHHLLTWLERGQTISLYRSA